ncbi:MAG: isocitrate/isopropylmalate dehydrogenase family protein [Candidatus Omnitrophica bacterium]|nr:isocitrate/isopropylmalate dehydrogenase family protein [Candidatus Omnitrophota bacterium]
MAHRIVFLPGDGIGPEVSGAARRCVDATGVAIEWIDGVAGEAAIRQFNTPLPPQTLELIRRHKVAIKGPITTPIGSGFRSVNVEIRRQLDLYACLRPCKSYAGVRAPYSDVNLVIVRENTEDLYAGIEFDAGSPEARELESVIRRLSRQPMHPDPALSIKPISAYATERIVRFAFDYAVSHGRKKVTAVTKANIMKSTDGLFLATARQVAGSYAGRVVFEERLIDNLCMQLVLRPQEYDVLVLPNLYGDIVSDLCAGLIGGLGVAPGANMGRDAAVFEAVHGSAPKYAGQNKVNPTAMILSAALMLEHVGERDAAQRLEQAVAAVLREGRRVTYDLKAGRGDASAVGTSQMADAIIEQLR